MKGEIFVEFIELVEKSFGIEVADRIIEAAELESGGVYTRVGTYDHGEMVRMVIALSKMTGVDLDELQRIFGKFLFSRLIGAHAGYIRGMKDTFSLLSRIEDTIHVNVRKLYPDASLPTITAEDNGDGSMEVYYRSKSGFGHVCHGLIEGCIEHFDENIAIQRVDRSAGPLDETARFLLTRN
jgi:hypothetical protein